MIPLEHLFFFDLALAYILLSFSKSKGQVMGHLMGHVISQVMGQCTSHDCWLMHHIHLSGDSGWWLSAKPWWLTAKDAVPILGLFFSFGDQAPTNTYHVIPRLQMYKRTLLIFWVLISTSCGFGTQVSLLTLMYYVTNNDLWFWDSACTKSFSMTCALKPSCVETFLLTFCPSHWCGTGGP
jgi:hypothetical protein